MNNFFYSLEKFFVRLHFIIAIVLILWQLFGQVYSFDTPLLIISSGFNIESGQAFAFLAGLIIVSTFFWSYLIGSFVDRDKVALEKLRIKEQREKMQLQKEKIEEISLQTNLKESNRKYFRDGVIFIIVLLVIFYFLLFS